MIIKHIKIYGGLYGRPKTLIGSYSKRISMTFDELEEFLKPQHVSVYGNNDEKTNHIVLDGEFNLEELKAIMEYMEQWK